MAMNLGQYTDYKKAIKDRVKDLQSSRPGFTLKRLAERIPIQYTYLSKVLNDESSHLNEDHLYQIGQILEFYAHESDFLQVLRAYQTTGNAARKANLFKQLERLGRDLGLSAKKQTGDAIELQREMRYLMDPFCMLVFVSLHIPIYRQDPKRLAAPLGLTHDRLKGILSLLAEIGQIEIGTTPFQIKKLNNSRTHFDKNHPLTRMHQHLLGITCQNQVLKLREEEKENLQITFTADEGTAKRVRTEIAKFMKTLEGEVSAAKDENLYQMNLQFFPWV
jgi:uncharacterized protein (TIGR02147 family)